MKNTHIMLKLLLMAMVTMAYAGNDLKALCRDTCGLLSRWTLTSHMSHSVRYVVQDELSVVPLASDCETQLEKAISSCLGRKECTSFDFSWAASNHERVEIKRFKIPRSIAAQDSDECSCGWQTSLATNETATTTPSEGTISTSASCPSNQEPSLSSSTSTSVIKYSRTSVSAAPLFSSMGATPSPSSGPEPVCIIKLQELNLIPPGQCYCTNGTTKKWKTGECDVYS